MRNTLNVIRLGLTGLILFFITVSCSSEKGEGNTSIPLVVATTGMIADMVKNLAGDQLEVVGLMGPGVDPHLYKATQRDLSLLRKADVIFFNGLHLEGKMGEVLESFSREKPVFAFSEGIPESALIQVDEATGSFDPHLWFDVSLWAKGIPLIEEKLSQEFPSYSEVFSEYATTYQDSLEALDSWVRDQINTLPVASRIMVTAHDAFAYFGKAYQVQVRGLQGISTVAEFGLKDRKELVDLIVERKIKSVFVETSVSSKSLEAVVSDCKQRGWEVNIGGTLFSDAMGASDTPEGTYIGMVRANVNTLIQGLN
ncbi:MAG: zinc ABC transporter substrate-binding protein [Bacteroidota bacterium]